MQEIAFDKFVGIYTRTDRGQRPLGAFDTCKNLFFNKIAYKPTLRTGYSTPITAAETEIGGNVTMTVFSKVFYPATENPSSQDILLLAGKDAGAAKYWFQSPYFDTAGATQAGYLMYGETLSTTISGAPSGATLVLAAGSSTADYYKYWAIHNTTRDQWMYVTAYAGSPKTITLNSNVPTGWVSTDAVKLYRHYHSDYTFSLGEASAVTWNTPVAVKVGNDIMFSGGRGSTVGYKLGWSGYLSKAFFPSSGSVTYKGTYVDQSEILPGGIVHFGASPSVTAGTGLSPAGAGGTYRWFLYAVYETDDGQRSLPVLITYQDVSAADKGISDDPTVTFAKLNKRLRYINYFMGYSTDATVTTLPWDQLFYVGQTDLLATGWTFIATSGTTPCSWDKLSSFNSTSWSTRAESLSDHIGGYTAANSSTVSCNYMEVLNGRMFVADYYDYYSALTYSDQVRFSGIGGNGAPQYSVLPDVDDFTQSTVDSGDPAFIQNIKGFENKLFVVKNRSCYFIDTSGNSSGWELEKISHEVGCDVPYSVTVTPYGIVWIKSGEDVYLWRGGNPVPLTSNWDFHPTDSTLSFRGLTTTYASSWLGWYDPLQKSYRFMYTSNGTTLTTVYEMYFELPLPEGGYVWTKHVFTDNIASVATRSNGSVYSVNGGTTLCLFDTSTNDGGVGNTIKPYADTGYYAISENDLAQVTGWRLSSTHVGTPSGTFDIKVYVDGNAVTFGSVDASTNTEHFYRSGMLLTANNLGRRCRMEFNANATPAFLGTAYTIHDLAFKYSPRRLRGDLRQNLK